jgi:hypothetical protein
MSKEKILQEKFRRSLGLVFGLLLAAPLVTTDAFAQGSERLGPFLRQYAAPQDRQVRDMQPLAAEQIRRQEADDSRNPRRWSPEERRQLRRDVHDAGRDVYGVRPRHSD